jgi:hypothetical protein
MENLRFPFKSSTGFKKTTTSSTPGRHRIPPKVTTIMDAVLPSKEKPSSAFQFPVAHSNEKPQIFVK